MKSMFIVIALQTQKFRYNNAVGKQAIKGYAIFTCSLRSQFDMGKISYKCFYFILNVC